ncbi:DUF3021 domain-containing protein [Salibacterium halotolerans]|uniref:DUF3021 domain-containing protein n=1 Tax=Salibacterium halotolerans TaxID=1884432 RepID=A0A1I5L5Z0_9BACI|nr:DUF3021 domain-containing protein [Salibacterium halotolerans]SFO92592.1 Protein of unknown function [Salibacterium halotolerans]
MKTIVYQSFLGICFGALVSILIHYGVILFGGVENIESGRFVLDSLGSMFCGWFFSTGGLIFAKENWSLTKRTIVHFITVTMLYFVLSFLIGWIPFTIWGFLIGMGLFLIIYTVIWFCFFVYFYYEMRKLNEALADRNS